MNTKIYKERNLSAKIKDNNKKIIEKNFINIKEIDNINKSNKTEKILINKNKEEEKIINIKKQNTINIDNKKIPQKEDKILLLNNNIKIINNETQNKFKKEILEIKENMNKNTDKKEFNIKIIKDNNDIIDKNSEKKSDILLIKNEDKILSNIKIKQENEKNENINGINPLIRQLRKENINMILKNMSKKKRNRKRYKRRRRNNTIEKDVHDDKKLKKLNKLHENDLSGISLGDSILLKTKDNFLTEDKEMIKKIKKSQRKYKRKLKREKKKKRKTKSKSKKKKKKLKKIKTDNLEGDDDNEKISDLNDIKTNIETLKKDDEEIYNINKQRNKRYKKKKRKINNEKEHFFEKIDESDEENKYKNSSISQNEQNKNILNEKPKRRKINLFKKSNSKIGIKNEEKVVESKDLKSSIMTDNISNFLNNQNPLQDNFSSTSYQTLQKILNKVEPKPSILKSKNNLSHFKPADSLYRTSTNFKSKIFNGSNYNNNNPINTKNMQLTPLYCKTNNKYSTKTDFYSSNNKLNNNSETNKLLSIDIEDINSDINHNNNFNASNNNFHMVKNKSNNLLEENPNFINKNNNRQSIQLSLKNIKNAKTIPSKTNKSSNSNNKNKYIKDLINNPNNPYSTKWQNSFLKKGFQLGLKYNKIHFGVPSLKIQKLNKNIILPPVYKIKYNQFSDNNNDIKAKENIVTYYNKDKTIKSLNLYLNLKEKTEAEMMKECREKIMKEFNIKENEEEEEEEEEDDDEEDEESDDEEDEESDDDEDDDESHESDK